MKKSLVAAGMTAAIALPGCAHRAPILDSPINSVTRNAPQLPKSAKGLVDALKDSRYDLKDTLDIEDALYHYIKDHPNDPAILQEVLPRLIEMVENGSYNHHIAADIISEIASIYPGHPGLENAVLALSKRWDVSAIRVLAKIGFLGSEHALIKGAKLASDRDLKETPAFSLRFVNHDPTFVPMLIEVIKLEGDRYWSLRTDAVAGLYEIYKNYPGNAEVLAAVPALIELYRRFHTLNETDATIKFFGMIGDLRAVPMIIEELEVWGARWCRSSSAAILALGEIASKNKGNPEIAKAFPVLVRILESGDHYLFRSDAATALGKTGDERALPALQKAAKNDPHIYVREHAGEAIKLF